MSTSSSLDWNWRQLAAAIVFQAVRDAEHARGGLAHDARSFLATGVASEILVELGVEPGGLARFWGEPVPEQLILEGLAG